MSKEIIVIYTLFTVLLGSACSRTVLDNGNNTDRSNDTKFVKVIIEDKNTSIIFRNGTVYTHDSGQNNTSPVIIIDIKTNNSEEIQISRRIVRGSPAALGEIPYIVSLKYAPRQFSIASNFCGGSLIKPNKVVSAGHCFGTFYKCCGIRINSGMSLTKTYAVAGHLNNQIRVYRHPDLQNRGQYQRLARVSVHPRYKFPINDVAVVHLRGSFRLNDHVQTINFARYDKDYQGDCLIAGYGKVNSRVVSPRLLVGKTTLSPKSVCNMLFRRRVPGLICTKPYPADTAKGDSGGPLVCKGTKEPGETKHGILVGIVSGGVDKKFSFFTRTSTYARFIENIAITQHNIKLQYIIFYVYVVRGLLSICI